MQKFNRKATEVYPVVKSAVNQLVDFVKPTYGSAQNKILIQKSKVIQQSIDDGALSAKQYRSDDAFENSVINFIRKISDKTNEVAGDGTTTSLITAQGLLKEIDKRFGKQLRNGTFNAMPLIKELKNAVAQLREHLVNIAKPVETFEELRKVAYLSFNNQEMAEMIAKILVEIGKDGVVSFEESKLTYTSYEIVKGMRFEWGHLSPHMVTDVSKSETVLKDPYIVLTDRKLSEFKEVLPLIEKMVQAGKKEALIIADDIYGETLATLVLNKLNGSFVYAPVKAPNFGAIRNEYLEDMAALTGGKVITETTAKSFDKATLADLGRADKVIITKSHTTIIGGKGSAEAIEKRIEELKARLKDVKGGYEENRLKERIAKLSSGIAVIRVGAPTEGEQQPLLYKLEDAVNATKAAYKSGVVCGAGLAMYRLEDWEVQSEIFREALKYPFRQLCENTGLAKRFLFWKRYPHVPHGDAINAITGEIGGYMELGIVDPVEVILAAIESAVSIVSEVISWKGITLEETVYNPS